MKTYAPKGLHGAQLREILADLHATPLEVARFLRVTERSVWRWLASDSAPFSVLAALWHETPAGRESAALDVGNEVVIQRGLARAHSDEVVRGAARLARLLAISDTGAANDAFMTGPSVSAPVLPAVDTYVGIVGPLLGGVGRYQGFSQVGPDGGVGSRPGHQLGQNK